MESNTMVKKATSAQSPRGQMGQTYLAAGIGVDMRLWRALPPGQHLPESARDYETVGYVLQGRAALDLEGQRMLLEPGDSWIVPKHARHRYEILETFTAIEATSPPARAQGRDLPPASD